MLKTHCQIFPSLLSADFLQLGDEVAALITAGADMLHVDIMDNHYVPNLTFGPLICQAIHTAYPKAALDVHLMVTPVDELIPQFAAAGATRISVHPGTMYHLDRSLQLIRDNHCQAGIALNPAVSPDCIEWCLHHVDFILVMTVNPGFGGQKLITDVIKKIAYIHQRYPHLPICVDGGVNLDNIQSLAKAGASQFVAGSAILHSKDYGKTIALLRQNASLDL